MDGWQETAPVGTVPCRRRGSTGERQPVTRLGMQLDLGLLWDDAGVGREDLAFGEGEG